MAKLRQTSKPLILMAVLWTLTGAGLQAQAASPKPPVTGAPPIISADGTGEWDEGPNSDNYTMLWEAKDGRSVSFVCWEDASLSISLNLPGRGAPQVRISLGAASHIAPLAGTSGNYDVTPKDPKAFLRDLARPGRLVIETGSVRLEPVEPPPEMRASFLRQCAEYWPPGALLTTLPKGRMPDLAPQAFAAARKGAALDQRVFRDQIYPGVPGPEMVALPPGAFLMGSPKGEGFDDERPQRTIRLDGPLAVGKYEVTWEEYNICHYEGPCLAPPADGFGGGRRPVTNVSYEDAMTYAAWLTARTGRRYSLLSEAEWEYAARAGTTTAYPWGPKIVPGKANCDGCGSPWDNRSTAPVGSFAPNSFGLHDMQGNVWEWVQDCFASSYAAGQPQNGAAYLPKDCTLRLNRGGSWYTSPSRLRSANRLQAVPTDRFREVGFRVASH